MTQIRFWILGGTCLLVGVLTLADIPATLWLQSDSRELRGMNLLIQQGEECNALWQKVAMRAYQLGQQDPALKEVLSHQKINITPRSATNAPASTPPATPHANP